MVLTRVVLAAAGLLLAGASLAQALLVQRPCCSAYAHAGASFGPQLPWVAPGVMGTLTRSQDKDCNGALPNSIVMIDRGLETFVEAVRACQAKGVVAVVVRSTSGGENDLITMGAAEKDTGVHIPSVYVSRKTGDELDAMLAFNPTVFVELFAADDVNSIMAYLAYLFMSVETLFFSVVFFSLVLFLASRRVARRNRICRRRACCKRREVDSTRGAILVDDRGLLEPLQPNAASQMSSNSADPESKPPKDRVTQIQSFPIVYANGVSQQQTVNVRVDPDNDEPLFDQQEQ